MAMPHAKPTAIDDLTRYYMFENETEVRDFLRSRPHLIPLLEEAVPHVYAAFGTGSPINLDVDWDDEEGEPPMLFAGIVTDKPALESLAALKRFDRSWWLEAGHAQLDLMFTTRSVRRRDDV
jgi:hypothetical protein